MNIIWRALSFPHSCGREGTILEVCVNRDGEITVSGVCAVCGEEFSVEDTFASIISKCAIKDYLDSQAGGILESFQPKGKPS